MKKKIITVFMLSALMLLTGCNGNYTEQAALVEDYFENELGIQGNVVSTTFNRYDEGITGGMYQYEFTFIAENGKSYNAYYGAYTDISADNIDIIKISE
ncbi:MAG: hypothetical protein IJ446_01105 [Oscillospiraceae bacterium]|nr:hypothetical protein [Oscillospiraceae bacterium]